MELLKTHEAAEYLRLSPRTLEHWRETGSGPQFVKMGRIVRYAREALEAYLANSKYRSTAEASKTSQYLREPIARASGGMPRIRRTRSGG